MHLKIITHEKIVFDENIDEIYSRSIDGEFGILKNHIPIMTALDIGITKVVQGKTVKLFTTMGGILQFKDEECIILTEASESGNEIDEMRAKESFERAKIRLAEAEATIDSKRAEAALARALARLKAKMNHG